MVSVAQEILQNAVVVAECDGTKSVFTEKLVGSFMKSELSERDRWLTGSLNKLNDIVSDKFLTGEGGYPADANHRVDYAVQIYPSSYEFSLCSRLIEVK